MAIAEPASTPQSVPQSEQRAVARSRLVTLVIMFGLYLLAVPLLLIRLGEYPAFAYNWEPYTAYGLFAFWDRPTWAIFRATGGLITDSSFSPLVILPGWLAFAVSGVGLLPMRIATALVAAGAVPLLWWTGRHFIGARAAFLAALLLALSPVYLLYGRTATLVGLSLVPALATIEALRQVLHRSGDRRWLLSLQVALIVGIYGYAPLRFLWLIALAFLALALALRPTEWSALRRAFLVTLLVPWLAISITSLRDPVTAVALYFQGRGEHVLGLTFSPSSYGFYLRPDPTVQNPGPPEGNPFSLAARLIAQNTGDLANLLLDRNTLPALTDYWNARGRLYPAFLLPFLAIGLLVAARGAWRRLEDQLLLVLAASWSLPMIITSKVHIGRLIFFLPLLCLLVASGATRATQWLVEHIPARFARIRPQRASRFASMLATALAAAILLPAVANATWRDYREAPPLPPDANIAVALRDAAGTHPPGIALILHPDVGEDPTEGVGEATQVASLRLSLDTRYHFVNLYSPEARPDPAGDAGRIPVYYGNLLALLGDASDYRLPCDVVYYIAPDAFDQFMARYSSRRTACGEPQAVVLQ